MTSSRAIQFFAAAIFLTLIFGWGIWVWFDNQEAALRAEQERFLSGRQMAWAQEDVQRASAAKQESAGQAKVRAEKFMAALGGPVEAAFKDPRLNISQMLNEVALACAPANSQVSVTVDRFTEFVVSVALPEQQTPSQLAEISKNLLPKSVPYIHCLRFIRNNLFLAELDWPAIESVTNWSLVSLKSADRLLSPANAQNEPSPMLTDANPGNPSNPAEEEQSPDQKKIETAETTFKQNYDTHIHSLNGLIASLDQATHLDALWTRDRLQSQVALLDQMASQLAAERLFFLNQSAEMNRLLSGQSLDPLAVTIIIRNIKVRERSDSAVLTGVFDAVAAYREKVRALLEGMGDRWGEWQADSSTKQILFLSEAARQTYLSKSALVTQSAQSVEAAFRLWADHGASKATP